MYERSGGAKRSRRTGIPEEGITQKDTDPPVGRGGRQAHLEGECAAAPPEQILDVRGEERRGRVELAQAENVGDALPGGIALPFESAEVGGCNGKRAVVEELADGLYGLADVTAELGGGVA